MNIDFKFRYTETWTLSILRMGKKTNDPYSDRFNLV